MSKPTIRITSAGLFSALIETPYRSIWLGGFFTESEARWAAGVVCLRLGRG